MLALNTQSFSWFFRQSWKGVQAILILLLVMGLLFSPVNTAQAGTVVAPSITIFAVQTDQYVTIRAHNFPANVNFVVRMGDTASMAVSGLPVATSYSGGGGSFEATYPIPASLRGYYQIAIRMEGGGYAATAWFYNNTEIVQPGKSPVPTFNITNVTPDNMVTVQTYNFPANKDFVVRMGVYGNLALNGIPVATFNSGAGGSFLASFPIPPALRGTYMIALRMDSTSSAHFAYNWFYNNTLNASGQPGMGTYATFNITSVVQDSQVTIQTFNFPANQNFVVRMGAYGTQGLNGTAVATFNSGAGGTFQAAFSIPAELRGSYQIAVRLETTDGTYVAYNWFYNNTASGYVPAPVYAVPGYTGIPTIWIVSVVRDSQVTVQANNFPPNQTFTVRMGAYGTLGMGGIAVATLNSGAGGSFFATYTIPDALKGSYQIAIRLENQTGYYYAYNWFFNNSTSIP